MSQRRSEPAKGSTFLLGRDKNWIFWEENKILQKVAKLRRFFFKFMHILVNSMRKISVSYMIDFVKKKNDWSVHNTSYKEEKGESDMD